MQALFPGNNDIDQMYRVFQVMGSPTPEVWPVSMCTVMFCLLKLFIPLQIPSKQPSPCNTNTNIHLYFLIIHL